MITACRKPANDRQRQTLNSDQIPDIKHETGISRLRLNPNRFYLHFAACVPPAAGGFFDAPSRRLRRLPSQSLTEGELPIDSAIVVLVSSSLALLVITLALVREVRLRRALQRLLSRLLAHFRGKEP
jgi:hypothetical protein